MRFLRGLALGCASAAVLAGAFAGAALANGVGDLYVATSAGVLELHVVTESVVNTIPVSPAATALAFSPDGRHLYFVSDGAHVTPIEIETLDVGDPIAMPGDVTALGFPNGQLLVGAIPSHRTLAIVSLSTSSVTETAELPGAPNLLAADRHDPRVVAAESGKSWLEVVDPSTASFRKVTVDGEVRAIAIERDRGGVLVATHAPDTVTRIDLTTLAVSWKAPLPSVPTAVAALAGSAVAAGGSTVWRVAADSAAAWATAKGEILGLAPSDEGKALHVGERDQIEVFGTDGKLVKSLALTGKTLSAMAPVPAGSSLFTGAHASAAKASAGTATSGAFESLPPTSTLATDVGNLVSEPRTRGAAIVALVVLAICWLGIRRYDAHSRNRG